MLVKPPTILGIATIGLATIGLAIAASPVGAQGGNTSSVQQGIDEMVQMLREEGVDIDARMATARSQCRERYGSQQQAVSDCSVVAQQVAYSAAINELHDTRQARYQAALATHAAEVAEAERRLSEHERQLAASKAEAEREMAQWREAVRRCEAGQRRYCSKGTS